MDTILHNRLLLLQDQRAVLISLSEQLSGVLKTMKITILCDEVRQLQQRLSFEKDASDSRLTYEDMEEKLAFVADRLMDIMQSAAYLVPVQRRLTQVSQEALQAKHTEILERLERLDSIRQHYLTLFSLVRSSLQEKTSTAATVFFVDIVDMFAVEPQNYTESQSGLPLDAFAWNMQQKQVGELTAYLTEAMQNEFEIWRNSILQPLLQNRLSWLGQELHEYSLQLSSGLKQIWFDLCGEESDSDEEREYAWEKLTLKMVLDAPRRIASLAAKQIEFVLDAPAMIARILERDSIQKLLENDTSFESIQVVVAQEYRQELLHSYQKWVEAIVAATDSELSMIQEELDHALRLELQIVRDVIQRCMVEKKQPEEIHQPGEWKSAFASLASELYSLRTFLKWYRLGLSP